MKIYIRTDKLSGGPGSFKNRLIQELRSLGALVTDRASKANVELSFIRRSEDSSLPCVLRLDGCYYVTKRLGMNQSLVTSARNSNHIIFQSEFSRKMCRSLLDINKPSTVVYNGIDLESIETVRPDSNIEPHSFVACAHWRENKRPKSTVLGFLEANTGRHLYMIGSGLKKMPVHRSVHYLDNLSGKQVLSVMKRCDYLLHLCHIDSCPNAVVEGLACGLNVLCTNLGGTKEIVGTDGVVLNVDTWNFKPIDKPDLDSINPSIVANGIRQIMLKDNRSVRPDLNIRETAKRYLNILQGVCR